jgi:hypothetical protein
MNQQRIYDSLSPSELMLGYGVSTDEWNNRYRPCPGSKNHCTAYSRGAFINADAGPSRASGNSEDNGEESLREGES